MPIIKSTRKSVKQWQHCDNLHFFVCYSFPFLNHVLIVDVYSNTRIYGRFGFNLQSLSLGLHSYGVWSAVLQLPVPSLHLFICSEILLGDFDGFNCFYTLVIRVSSAIISLQELLRVTLYI